MELIKIYKKYKKLKNLNLFKFLISNKVVVINLNLVNSYNNKI